MKKTLLLFSFFMLLAAKAQTISTVFSNQTLNTSGIAIEGNLLYAADFMDGKIYRSDLSQPNIPPVILVSGTKSVNDICIRGNYLYASRSANTAPTPAIPSSILRIDISQPNPVVETLIDIEGSKGMTIHNQYLYVSSRNNIVRINLDLPVPTPEVIITDGPGQGTMGLAVIGNYLFVAKHNELLKYSLLQPDPTKIIVATNLPRINSIAKGETNTVVYACVFDNRGGVLKINTANGTFADIGATTLRTNWDILYKDNNIYVSDCEGGNVVKIGPDALSVEDLEANKIKIYPVPAAGVVHFENCTFLGLTDINGKQINLNSNDSKIDMSMLPKGIYIAKIEAEGKILYKKIAKN